MHFRALTKSVNAVEYEDLPTSGSHFCPQSLSHGSLSNISPVPICSQWHERVCSEASLFQARTGPTYVSFTLRKYDELVGNGLPLKSPVKDMDPRETLTVPARFQSGGGTDAREILVLAAATKLVRPRRIFEIGTYNGRTTAVFIMNAPSNCQVYTLDLPPQSNASSDYLASDAELVETRSTETFLQRARLGRR